MGVSMKYMMKWAGGLLLLGVVFFVGLILVLPMVIDPNDYKDKISDLVYENSGYKIEIPGDIGLHVSPRLDVLFSLGEVRVFSGSDFPEVTLVSSEEVRVELSLLPLLREKRLAIQGLQLHGGYCYLIRNKAGKGNWELPSDLVVSPPPSDSASQAPEVAAEKKIKAEKEKKALVLDLEMLEFSRINVRYEDQQTDKRFELKNFSIRTGHVQDRQSFHLQSNFTLTSSGSNNSVLSVVNALETDVTLALEAGTIQLDHLSLVSLINGFGMQESEVKLATNAFIAFSNHRNRLVPTLIILGDSLSVFILLKREARRTGFQGAQSLFQRLKIRIPVIGIALYQLVNDRSHFRGAMLQSVRCARHAKRRDMLAHQLLDVGLREISRTGEHMEEKHSKAVHFAVFALWSRHHAFGRQIEWRSLQAVVRIRIGGFLQRETQTKIVKFD